jgi:bacterioferritin (cytochrome b1)
MEQNEKLITVLNKILVEELSVSNQNNSRSKVISNLDDDELNEEIEKETSEKLKQAEWLIKRIIFLEVCRTHKAFRGSNQNKTECNYEKIRNVG